VSAEEMLAHSSASAPPVDLPADPSAAAAAAAAEVAQVAAEVAAAAAAADKAAEADAAAQAAAVAQALDAEEAAAAAGETGGDGAGEAAAAQTEADELARAIAASLESSGPPSEESAGVTAPGEREEDASPFPAAAVLASVRHSACNVCLPVETLGSEGLVETLQSCGLPLPEPGAADAAAPDAANATATARLAALREAAADAVARHEARLRQWVVGTVAEGQEAPPQPPSLQRYCIALGVPHGSRWHLWHRMLNTQAMPSLQARARQVATLATEWLPGANELRCDVDTAVLATLATLPKADGDEADPTEAAAALSTELNWVLTLLLKALHVPFTSDLGLAELGAPIVLLAAQDAATAAAAAGQPAVSGAALHARRSALLNLLTALLHRLQPALMARRPWGLTAGGASVAPSAPNQALLTQLALLVQYHAPALWFHLQRGTGVLGVLARALMSLLATQCDAPALLRLVELSMLTGSLPCEQPLLLLALLLESEAPLLGAQSSHLVEELHALRLHSAADAQRVHQAARVLHDGTPRALREALGVAWSASSAPSPPPYVAAWLEPAEVGTAALHSKTWVVDCRSQAEFDAASFALTRHLSPDQLVNPAARERARVELSAIAAELRCGVAFLTAGGPTTAAGCSGVPPEVVSLAIREFVQAGFARVGVVMGGFAGLSADQRAGLVSDGSVSDAAGGRSSKAKNVSGLMKDVSSFGGGVAKNVLGGVRKLSFGRRPRVDPSQSEGGDGGDPFPAPGGGEPPGCVAQCPSCKRELRIPESSLASAEATAFQCPGCGTRFMVARQDPRV
jgi:hypothetical protein